jgi:hypothetical protein
MGVHPILTGTIVFLGGFFVLSMLSESFTVLQGLVDSC